MIDWSPKDDTRARSYRTLNMADIISNYLLPVAQFCLMISMGLSLVVADFMRVFKMGISLAFAVSAILFLLPALGLLIAYLYQLPPDLALGLVLVAACPGGLFSNLLTTYARGDLAMSVSMTALVSVFSTLTLPAATVISLTLFHGESETISLPAVEILIKVFLLTIVPVCIGMIVRRIFEHPSVVVTPWVKNISAMLILCFFIVIAADNWDTFIAAFKSGITAVLTLNISVLLVGVVTSTVIGLNRQQRIAVVIEHIIKQEGTGIYIAIAILALPTAALPLLLNSITGLLIGTGYVLLVNLHRQNA